MIARLASLVAAALAVAAAPGFAKTDWTRTPPAADKAYVLLQIEPLEFKMMGNNQVVTGIFLAPYDAGAAAIRQEEQKGKPPRIARIALRNEPTAKDGKRRQYFAEIAPGTWVIEGAGGDVPQAGAPLTSFSLSSYRFDAKPGEIIDLGVALVAREESDNPDTKMSSGKLLGMMFAGPFGGGRIEPLPLKIAFRARASGDLPVPGWVPQSRLVQPALVYGATFANHLGGLINRIDGKEGRKRAAAEAAPAVAPAADGTAGDAKPDGQ